MKNILFISIVIVIFFSCKNQAEKIIHYEFKGIMVSRYDLNKRTYLYYGDCNNINSIIKNASAIVDWQFDDFLQVSLIFHEDRKVEIISGGGGELKKLSQKNEIYFNHYESPEYSKIMDNYTFPKDLNNLCYINDNIQFELEENKKFKSKVVITHKLSNDKVICP